MIKSTSETVEIRSDVDFVAIVKLFGSHVLIRADGRVRRQTTGSDHFRFAQSQTEVE